MSEPTITAILEAAKNHVSGYINDTLPILVAIADPKEIEIGITVQRDYPLTMIERNYGIPFGRLRSNPTQLISDPDELHGYKFSIDVHEAVFGVDQINEILMGHRGDPQFRGVQVVALLSTGIGNVLQNLRALALADRSFLHVEGENVERTTPYACLVSYSQSRRIGIELLLFNRFMGAAKVNKFTYLGEESERAGEEAQWGFDSEIKWAASGYPLVLGQKEVPLEKMIYSISDYRHVWRLPMLKQSISQHLIPISQLSEEEKKNIEFWFATDELKESEYFNAATSRGILEEMRLAVPLTDDWVNTVCTVCKIERGKLYNLQSVNRGSNQLELKPEEVEADFKAVGYQKQNSAEGVVNPGDFFIDKERGKITVKLLPAIYPHHIVGVTESGKVVNISIMGQSGRSGVTIEDAKKLAIESQLTDAIICDNGNDVVARIAGGSILRHKKNNRQTRLTAALHFGYPILKEAFEKGGAGGDFEGFDLTFTTCQVEPK